MYVAGLILTYVLLYRSEPTSVPFLDKHPIIPAKTTLTESIWNQDGQYRECTNYLEMNEPAVLEREREIIR